MYGDIGRNLLVLNRYRMGPDGIASVFRKRQRSGWEESRDDQLSGKERREEAPI